MPNQPLKLNPADPLKLTVGAAIMPPPNASGVLASRAAISKIVMGPLHTHKKAPQPAQEHNAVVNNEGKDN